MIECSNEYIYYKRKNRKISFKRFFYILIIIAIILSLFLYYKKVTIPHIEEVCFEKVKSVNVKCVNLSLIKTLSVYEELDDFIFIEKNASGEIVLISSNSKKINEFSRRIVENVQNTLCEELKEGIKLPWMAFSGLVIFSGYGSEVNFNAITAENVSCNLISNFTANGINQTLHSIRAEIVSEIVISFPLNTVVKSCSTEVLITETVLIGKVPEFYLGNKVLT